MLQISENAGKLIRKMTAKNGIPGGGLRIGIKAGGCSGLSYTFAWEAAPRDGDHMFDGPDGARVFVDPQELQVPRRHDARLRHEPREQGLHLQQPEREEHVRVRDVVQRRSQSSDQHDHIHRNHRTARDPRIQVRLRHRRRAATRSRTGLNEDVVRLISQKKNEPEWLLEWRLKAYRAVADDEGADLAERQVRPDRLPGHHLLLGAEEEEGAEQPRRSRSGSARDLRQARHPARRAEAARRRRGRRGVRQRVGRDDVPRASSRELGIIFCSFSEAVQRPSRSW